MSNPLSVVESSGRHRLQKRKPVLRLVPKGSVGAEIGVFTGLFSRIIAEVCKPQKLYLVDPWDLLHKTHFPNWGNYTNHVSLPTKDAETAVRARAADLDCECEVIKAFSTDWMASLPPACLDFVYLDAAHNYDAVFADLTAIERILKPGGIILGDDAWVRSTTDTSDVFRAVTAFSKSSGFDFFHLDAVGQWAISAAK